MSEPTTEAGRRLLATFETGNRTNNSYRAVICAIEDEARAPLDAAMTEPRTAAGRALAVVLQKTGWRAELFWNGSGGWFTARLISPWDHRGNATYPGGFLAPFDNPLGASGATPEEAFAHLAEAVLEWA